MGCITVSLSCQDVNDKVHGTTSFSKSIPEMIRSHDFPFYPGAKSIASGREVSALASKLLVREIEAFNEMLPWVVAKAHRLYNPSRRQ